MSDKGLQRDRLMDILNAAALLDAAGAAKRPALGHRLASSGSEESIGMELQEDPVRRPAAKRQRHDELQGCDEALATYRCMAEGHSVQPPLQPAMPMRSRPAAAKRPSHGAAAAAAAAVAAAAAPPPPAAAGDLLLQGASSSVAELCGEYLSPCGAHCRGVSGGADEALLRFLPAIAEMAAWLPPGCGLPLPGGSLDAVHHATPRSGRQFEWDEGVPPRTGWQYAWREGVSPMQAGGRDEGAEAAAGASPPAWQHRPADVDHPHLDEAPPLLSRSASAESQGRASAASSTEQMRGSFRRSAAPGRSELPSVGAATAAVAASPSQQDGRFTTCAPLTTPVVECLASQTPLQPAPQPLSSSVPPHSSSHMGDNGHDPSVPPAAGAHLWPAADTAASTPPRCRAPEEVLAIVAAAAARRQRLLEGCWRQQEQQQQWQDLQQQQHSAQQHLVKHQLQLQQQMQQQQQSNLQLQLWQLQHLRQQQEHDLKMQELQAQWQRQQQQTPLQPLTVQQQQQQDESHMEMRQLLPWPAPLLLPQQQQQPHLFPSCGFAEVPSPGQFGSPTPFPMPPMSMQLPPQFGQPPYSQPSPGVYGHLSQDQYGVPPNAAQLPSVPPFGRPSFGAPPNAPPAMPSMLEVIHAMQALRGVPPGPPSSSHFVLPPCTAGAAVVPLPMGNVPPPYLQGPGVPPVLRPASLPPPMAGLNLYSLGQIYGTAGGGMPCPPWLN